MNEIEERIRAALGADIDPYLGQDLISAGALTAIDTQVSPPQVKLALGFPVKRYGPELETRLRQVLASAGLEASFDISAKIVAHEVQKGTKRLPQIRNIIAIASGKGGVGKSTTAANLALALLQEGATVGVLDADIYGPSQTRMLASQGRPESRDGKSMEPRVSYGLQTISIGNLIEEDTPMIWRGPMVTGALEQLLSDTNWHDLDYLVIDLPPGTGDIQLTLCQKVPVSGAVIVTTPQDIALLDARKGLTMFEKVGVPILGIVENMAVHVCSQCGHAEHIFGEDGGKRMAAEYAMDYLGALPLSMAIRVDADSGHPSVVSAPDGEVAGLYKAMARQVAVKIAKRAKDFSAKFPSITISKGT